MSGIMMAAMAAGVANPVPNPLPSRSAIQVLPSPATAAASVTFATDGAYTATGQSATSWYVPNTAGIGSSYWVRATLTSGTTPSGPTMGTWVQISTNRAWQLVQSSIGVTDCVLGLSVATDASGTNIVATGTADIYVEVSL